MATSQILGGIINPAIANPAEARARGILQGQKIIGFQQQQADRERQATARTTAGSILGGQFGPDSQQAQLASADPALALKVFEAAGIPANAPQLRQQFAQALQFASSQVTSGNTDGAIETMNGFKAQMQGFGVNTQGIDSILQNAQQDPNLIPGFVKNFEATGLIQGIDPQKAATLAKTQAETARIQARTAGGGELPAGTVEFERLIADFTPEQQKDARLVAAGLKGRTVSNAVLGAIASGQLDSLAAAEGQIAQERKFGAMTGSSRASTIDKGFERIVKIDAGIGNIDAAIEAVQAGAGVGVIQSKFPSIRAASVALDQIQKSMALDVIGAVTFGALSKGELDLAREVALPVGMEGPALIAHLNNRKAAQTKLRGYFNDQIQHLDQGGTVASFMRKMEREPQGQQPVQGGAANIIRFDAQGNQI